MQPDVFVQALEKFSTLATAVVVLAFMLVAFKSGILRRVRFGSFEILASKQERDEARALIERVVAPDREGAPFETEQLAQYYAQVLAQSRTSFWFSLVFASIGFLVIVVAGFTYSRGGTGATVAQFIAGLVMDAVSALFFVQSKTAQKAMGEFFDKLRRDRQQVESRKLAESISDPAAKDALRIQLALHYADVPKSDEISQSIIGRCFGKREQ